VLACSNGADVDIPDPGELIAEFNQALAEPPPKITQADRDKQVLLTALQLR
jgi:hypothetical protein